MLKYAWYLLLSDTRSLHELDAFGFFIIIIFSPRPTHEFYVDASFPHDRYLAYVRDRNMDGIGDRSPMLMHTFCHIVTVGVSAMNCVAESSKLPPP